MAYRHFFFSVSSVLTDIAHRYGLETTLTEYHLQHHWPEIAGASIAAHTRPDAIRFRRLYLIVENSVWLQQLTFLKPTLIEKINAAAGHSVLSDIVLRVGEVALPSESLQGDKTTARREEPIDAAPSEESRMEATVYAEAVRDPDLRARLETVMAKALSSPPRPPGRESRKP
jgi:hypothetical protein